MSLAFPESAPSEEALTAGQKLFNGPVDFLKGVVAMDGLPPGDRVEVCFAGRSNVGKSSLINALTGRKGLARASNTPGRTQEINIFTLADAAFLVDLPGYGYAKAPVATVEKWQKLMRAYLRGRANLRRVFLLIDHRHGPKPVDEEIMSMLDAAAVPFHTVLTKADKLKDSQRARIADDTRKVLSRHPAAFPEIITTSSEDRTGMDRLRGVVADILDA